VAFAELTGAAKAAFAEIRIEPAAEATAIFFTKTFFMERTSDSRMEVCAIRQNICRIGMNNG
jgi:hypothetical protein